MKNKDFQRQTLQVLMFLALVSSSPKAQEALNRLYEIWEELK